MKMIITAVVLVLAIAVLFIFTLALAKAASVKTELEQMLEDEDQRRYLEACMKRKRGFGCIDNTSGDAFGHKVESANTVEKTRQRRGQSANFMARWSCAWENRRGRINTPKT